MKPEELLRECAPSTKVYKLVLAHSRLVTQTAMQLADRVCVPVDKQLVYMGGMLHDIGRFRCPPHSECSILHGIEGGKILKSRGLPQLVGFAENHIGAGLTEDEAVKLGLPRKDYSPKTVEEKLVCYADKLVNNDKRVMIGQRIQEYEEKYGHAAAERLKALHRQIMSWIA